MRVQRLSKRELRVAAICGCIALASCAAVIYYGYRHPQEEILVSWILAIALITIARLLWAFAFRTFPPEAGPPPGARRRTLSGRISLLIYRALVLTAMAIFLFSSVPFLVERGISIWDLAFFAILVIGVTVISRIFNLLSPPVQELITERYIPWWVAPIVIACTLLVILAITLLLAKFRYGASFF